MKSRVQNMVELKQAFLFSLFYQSQQQDYKDSILEGKLIIINSQEILESLHVYGQGKTKEMVFDQLDNVIQDDIQNLLIVSQLEIGSKQSVQYSSNLCKTNDDCQINETCQQEKCQKQKFEFKRENQVIYEGIEDYYIFMKFNQNYIYEEIFQQNQLVMYPELQFNAFQIKDFIDIDNEATHIFKA